MAATRAGDVIQSLRLHTDDNDFVWYGDDDQLAVNSFTAPEDFFGACRLGCHPDEVRSIRLIGCRANAVLVTELQRRRASNPSLNKWQKVRLCSPGVVPTAGMLRRPEEVLQHLWQPTCPSSLPGQWHDMDSSDALTYTLLKEMRRSESADARGRAVVSQLVKELAPFHPAWMAVAYLGRYSHESACRLMTDVVDPRWYGHPLRPDRNTRLYAHLGLTPQNARAYLGLDSPGRHYNRARTAIDTWYDVPPGRENFFWRLLRGHSDGAKGLLHATRRFVSFFRAVWLYGIVPAHPEVSFSPAMFFGESEEAEAFEAFRKAWKAA